MKSFLVLTILYCIGFEPQIGSGLNPDTKYTPQEKQGLKQLKSAIANQTYADYQSLDWYLIHSLRRKKLNVGQTVKMLQENFQWRKENKIDGILEEQEMIKLEKKFPITIDSLDRDGRPTLSYILNKWDIRRFVLAGGGEEMRRYQIYILEKATNHVVTLALNGSDVSQFNILIDLNGYNTRQHGCLACLQPLTDFLPLIETSYPEITHVVIFVNAPRSFEAVVNLIKGFLNPTRRDHIHVFGYDKTDWRRFIQRRYDDSQLSANFGGTRTKQGIKA